MIVEPGIYKHRSGRLYEVLFMALDSEDCTRSTVIYRQLEPSDFPTGTIWHKEVGKFLMPGRFIKQSEYAR
jgi:hypothetical protein